MLIPHVSFIQFYEPYCWIFQNSMPREGRKEKLGSDDQLIIDE